MALKPTPVNEIPPYLKFLLYGAQGEGKTAWTALNAPKPVWLDFERSSDTIKSMGIKGVEVIEITPHHKPKEVEDFCRDIDRTDFETVVFDTISTSQLFQLGASIADKKQDHPLIQDYRDSTQVFNDVFLRLQHSKKHVVLIAHERTIWEGDLSNRRKIAIGPSVTPALHDSVTQLVSGVFRLQRKTGLGKDAKPSWNMLVNSKGLYLAKNRYGLTETEIESPTWDTFMKGMLNNGNA